jgi:hypothetical protein
MQNVRKPLIAFVLKIESRQVQLRARVDKFIPEKN